MAMGISRVRISGSLRYSWIRLYKVVAQRKSVWARQLFLLHDKYFAFAAGRVDPCQWNVREGVFDKLAVVADFDGEQALWLEGFSRFVQYAPDDVESVFARCQRQRWLVAIFLRQCRHRCTGDIRRIGEDQIVPLLAQAGEEVRLTQ